MARVYDGEDKEMVREAEANWAEYYKEESMRAEETRPVDPELERLLAQEEELERQARADATARQIRLEAEERISLALGQLGWLAELAAEAQEAEVLLAIATVVKFTRLLNP